MRLYLSPHAKVTVCVDTDCIDMQVKFVKKKKKKKKKKTVSIVTQFTHYFVHWQHNLLAKFISSRTGAAIEQMINQ